MNRRYVTSKLKKSKLNLVMIFGWKNLKDKNGHLVKNENRHIVMVTII